MPRTVTKPSRLTARRNARNNQHRPGASNTAINRLRRSVAMVGVVIILGSIGYLLLGLTPLNSLYQTVTTITTVGFREVEPFGTSEKIYSIFVIILGVGTVLYTFTYAVQVVVEGQLRDFMGRRRMDREIKRMTGHTVVCWWGRVGSGVAEHLRSLGEPVVVIEENAARVVDLDVPTIVGDATLDSVLRAAGIEQAKALVTALQGDADNLFVTLSSRAINPDLFIVARARKDESVPKLANAGADRVVNPQELGAARMASFVARPNVAEFVDVVMHERSMEFRMQEFEVTDRSPLAGRLLGDVDLRRKTGALVLALREPDGGFSTNPDPDTVVEPGHVIIAVGTDDDLERLEHLAMK